MKFRGTVAKTIMTKTHKQTLSHNPTSNNNELWYIWICLTCEGNNRVSVPPFLRIHSSSTNGHASHHYTHTNNMPLEGIIISSSVGRSWVLLATPVPARRCVVDFRFFGPQLLLLQSIHKKSPWFFPIWDVSVMQYNFNERRSLLFSCRMLLFPETNVLFSSAIARPVVELTLVVELVTKSSLQYLVENPGFKYRHRDIYLISCISAAKSRQFEQAKSDKKIGLVREECRTQCALKTKTWEPGERWDYYSLRPQPNVSPNRKSMYIRCAKKKKKRPLFHPPKRCPLMHTTPTTRPDHKTLGLPCESRVWYILAYISDSVVQLMVPDRQERQ